MTPVTAALYRVLDDLDGLGLSACEQTGVAYALLAQALAYRSDREWVLDNLECNLRADIAKLQAAEMALPKVVTNGNGKGAGFLGANGAGGH